VPCLYAGSQVESCRGTTLNRGPPSADQLLPHLRSPVSGEKFAPYDIFQWLPSDVRAAFESAARIQRFSARDLIFAEGDLKREMFRIVSGTVRLSVARANGHEVIYTLFEPGDCFGDSTCIDGAPRSQTAEAASAVVAQVLGQAAFDRLRNEYRAFDNALLHLITRQVRLLSVFNADSHLNDLPARVARRIVNVAGSFGIEDASGMRLSFRLPQSELAMLVGASRQTVNKVLQQFQKEGLLRTEYGSLVILELERLKLKAGST
jgi:CRP/FNR family cyclic AMP-dependent transcriptional regulator